MLKEQDEFVIEFQTQYCPKKGSIWTLAQLCLGFDYRRVRDIAMSMQMDKPWTGYDFRIKRLRPMDELDRRLKMLMISRGTYVRALDASLDGGTS